MFQRSREQREVRFRAGPSASWLLGPSDEGSSGASNSSVPRRDTAGCSTRGRGGGGSLGQQGPGIQGRHPPLLLQHFQHTALHPQPIQGYSACQSQLPCQQQQQQHHHRRHKDSQQQQPQQQHHGALHEHAFAWLGACASACANIWSGAGWAGSRRAMVLASLTTSSVSTAAQQQQKQQQGQLQGQGAGEGQPGRKGWQGWLVGLQLPPAFRLEQANAALIMRFHTSSGQPFPRPCPKCGSSDFMTDSQGRPVHEEGGQGQVEFRSRPWSCDQCHRWWHLGCLGVSRLDQLPVKPWFHCDTCRRMFLSLESAASKGPAPAWELGLAGAGQYTVALTTDTDHRNFLMGAPAVAAGGEATLAEGYELLVDAFPPATLMGYGNPASEYSGGRYSLLLRHNGGPVAVATFDVYGSHAAQLALLTTARDARKQGHARALLSVLEQRLSDLGVARLLVQPRAASQQLFCDSLGFSVLHPADAAQLHTQVPVCFMDAVLLGKQLQRS